MPFLHTKDFCKKISKKTFLFFKGSIKEWQSFPSHLNGAYLVPRQIKILKAGIRIEAVPLVENI